MGLDSVELVMAFEDEFKISIPDEKWVNATTVGIVADLFLEEMNKCQTGKCQSQVAFYQLRRYFVEEMKIPRNSIRINSSLSEIFPLPIRRRQWNLFTSNSNLVWQNKPFLYYSLGLSKPLRFLQNSLSVLSFVQLILFGLKCFLFGGLAVFLFLVFSNRYRHVFPNGFSTVLDLIPITCIPPNLNLTREEILNRLIEITSVHLHIPKKDIHENSHFRYDLGVD